MQNEKPEAFKLGETVLFIPACGDQEEVEIVALPDEATPKYKVKFPDKTVYPVNPCYLKRKE